MGQSRSLRRRPQAQRHHPRAASDEGREVRRRVPDEIERIRGSSVADRAPAQSAVRTFIVRLMSQGSEIRNREIHT